MAGLGGKEEFGRKEENPWNLNRKNLDFEWEIFSSEPGSF